ncbi:DUF397 domain-containing protein [Saccharopolyspora elongata]|uniref:DUF397 domain-containing protein n=1 Tax=Saccharopolyspora elongata TaxID=2530387 RepID=A0A4R4YDL8_9PSEU|nr:DUF397 domain-containing protein [Saccharopolyspora elongata]TDD42791.1 DUF397 domain-containing protein [Saccharopolyspora elongata]
MSNLNGAVWRKSSRSHEQGQCVELAQNLPGVAAVRDSKTPEQGALVFTKAQIQTFLSTVKSGRLDL